MIGGGRSLSRVRVVLVWVFMLHGACTSLPDGSGAHGGDRDGSVGGDEGDGDGDGDDDTDLDDDDDDEDGDGVGDAGMDAGPMYDPNGDEDQDGVLNRDDNCVLDDNVDQADADSDGV